MWPGPDTVSGMAPRTYPSGVPCWIDIEPVDADAAQRFYSGLFGWTFADAMPPGAPGYYLIAQLEGDVAAMASREAVSTGAWNTYIAVDDVDAATADRPWPPGASSPAHRRSRDPRRRDGPRSSTRPADGSGSGRPARRLRCARLSTRPGAWNFSDLHTADPAAARAFYEPLFGWEADELGGDAAMWRRPGYGDHLASTVDPGHHRSSGRGVRPTRVRGRDRAGWLRRRMAKNRTGT